MARTWDQIFLHMVEATPSILTCQRMQVVIRRGHTDGQGLLTGVTVTGAVALLSTPVGDLAEMRTV